MKHTFRTKECSDLADFSESVAADLFHGGVRAEAPKPLHVWWVRTWQVGPGVWLRRTTKAVGF